MLKILEARFNYLVRWLVVSFFSLSSTFRFGRLKV